jgi:pimeloyl-ACP methyl ester carboxylesterase
MVFPTRVVGNAASKEILFYIHGWPDCSHVFNPLIVAIDAGGQEAPAAANKGKYKHVLIELPGSHDEDFDSLSMNFPKLIAEVLATIALEKHPVTLIAHDWGSVLAQGVTKSAPNLVKKLVLFDVGVQTTTKQRLAEPSSFLKLIPIIG